MYNFPIGAMVDSFRQDTREAIKTAAGIGVKGLQMYSTTGENSPENLVGQKRKDLLNSFWHPAQLSNFESPSKQQIYTLLRCAVWDVSWVSDFQ